MDIITFFIEYPTLYLLTIGLFSLVVGSFLNVVIYRLPRMMEREWSEECRVYLGLKPHTDEEKLSLALPFSHCPRCKRLIRPWHNIPILSYILLHGKCAYCKASISIRYPMVETLTCLISVYVAWRFGITWQTAAGLFFSWICIALVFIDLDFHLLPDQLTLLLLWSGLFCSLFSLFCPSHAAIIGGIAGYLIFAITQLCFKWCTGKIGMGQGDFKFLAALGAFLGWEQLPFIILLASFSGVIISLTHMSLKREFKSVPLPFGPYLAIAGWIALMWGHEIMQYYLEWIY